MRPTGAEFTPAQIDRAKRLLGRLQFRSRVIARLQKHYELDRNAANRLLAAAQADAYRAMCGEAGDGDPLACALFYQAVMADPQAETRDKLKAADGLVRLLGLHRAIKPNDGGGGGDAIIEAILKRQQGSGRRGRPELVPPKGRASVQSTSEPQYHDTSSVGITMSVAEAPAVPARKPRRGHPAPPGAGTDPVPHAEWAKSVARRVVRRTGLWRHREELEGGGGARGVRACGGLLPGPLRLGSTHTEAFRGYAYRRVEARVCQHAERLENAGTYHTRKYAKGRPPIFAASLSALAGRGEALDLLYDDEVGEGRRRCWPGGRWRRRPAGSGPRTESSGRALQCSVPTE